jgi:hypothetical protein
MNAKKFYLAILLSFITIWASQFLILSFLHGNNFITDVVLFIYPLIAFAGSSVFFFLQKKNDIAIGIIIGGALYWIGFSLINIVFLGEAVCGRYFFNLLTNCPGIK